MNMFLINKYKKLSNLLYSYETEPEKVQDYLTKNFQDTKLGMSKTSIDIMNNIISGAKVDSTQIDSLICELNSNSEFKEGQTFMTAAGLIIFIATFITGIVFLGYKSGLGLPLIIWISGFAIGSLLIGISAIISLLSRINLELIRSNRK